MIAVTLIGKSNGVGLSRDLRLLADTLEQCGCSVQVHAAQRRDGRQRRSLAVQTLARARAWLRGRRAPRTAASVTAAATTASTTPLHVNLMLEHVWPQFLHTADLNIAVPNPEWFDRRDQRLLSALDGVWAKTRHTQAVFSQLGCRTAFIGFDSEDRYEANTARERTFFHLAGKSQMKGTEHLLRVWQRHPEWPMLIVLYHVAEGRQGAGREVPAAANIRWHRDYLPDAELRALQNRSRFHLCLSEAEGWGHYLVEALSTSAVTLTLDAAPMNELVQPERGVLVGCARQGRQHLADTFGFDDRALEQAVHGALALDEPQLTRIGAAARAWFLDNRHGFAGRIGQALARL